MYSFEYETIETHAHAFLTLNILAIGRVSGFSSVHFADMIYKLQFTVDKQVSISAEPNFASTLKGVVAQPK